MFCFVLGLRLIWVLGLIFFDCILAFVKSVALTLQHIWKMKCNVSIKCIPKQWKEHTYNQEQIDFLSFNVGRKSEIEKEMNSRAVYKQIIQKIIVSPASSENFFKQQLDIESEYFEQIYCIPFNATIYTKLRSFQFKINHNILYTNEKLYKVKISDTSLCTFCKNEIETLAHLFAECNKVTKIWKEVTEKLLQPFGVKSLSKKKLFWVLIQQLIKTK